MPGAGGPADLQLEAEVGSDERLCYHLLCEQLQLIHEPACDGAGATGSPAAAGRQLRVLAHIRADPGNHGPPPPAAPPPPAPPRPPPLADGDRPIDVAAAAPSVAAKTEESTLPVPAARAGLLVAPDCSTYKVARVLLLDGQGRMLVVRDAEMQQRADRGTRTKIWTSIGGKKQEADGDSSWATVCPSTTTPILPCLHIDSARTANANLEVLFKTSSMAGTADRVGRGGARPGRSGKWKRGHMP